LFCFGITSFASTSYEVITIANNFPANTVPVLNSLTNCKIEPPTNQTVNIGSVTITILVNQDNTFNWNSNVPIEYVFAKGGSGGGGRLYHYTPATTSGNGLYCGQNPNGNNNYYGLSHITFYWSKSIVTPTPFVTTTPIITPTPTPVTTTTPIITETPIVTTTPSVTVTPTPVITPTPNTTSTPEPSVTPTPSVTETPIVTEDPTQTPTTTPVTTSTSTETPNLTLPPTLPRTGGGINSSEIAGIGFIFAMTGGILLALPKKRKEK
jgi:LPXTG-motif cell wall-anchored protein